MKLEKKNLIVERPYKSVYKTEEGVVKIFVTDHPKSAVFNEALNTVKVEETGLDIPKLKEDNRSPRPIADCTLRRCRPHPAIPRQDKGAGHNGIP